MSTNLINFITHYHGFSCHLTLKTDEAPDFLRGELKNGEQPIFRCQNIHVAYPLSNFDVGIHTAMIAKLFFITFEQLYHLTAHKGILGILFMVSDDQAKLLEIGEGVFSYNEPHLDQKGERTYLYMPTMQADYDYFIEASEEMLNDLDQVLWHGPEVNHLTRH